MGIIELTLTPILLHNINMTELQFQEGDVDSNFRSRVLLGHAATPKMVSGLIKLGIVKNEKTAGYILLGISGLAIIVAMYITIVHVFNVGNSPRPAPNETKQI